MGDVSSKVPSYTLSYVIVSLSEWIDGNRGKESVIRRLCCLIKLTDSINISVELNFSNIIANVPTLKLFFSRKSRARREAKELSRTHEELERSAFRRRLRPAPKLGTAGSVHPVASKCVTETNTAWTMNDIALCDRDPEKGVEASAESYVRRVDQGDEEQGTIHVRVMVSQHIAQRSDIERLLDRHDSAKTDQ